MFKEFIVNSLKNGLLLADNCKAEDYIFKSLLNSKNVDALTFFILWIFTELTGKYDCTSQREKMEYGLGMDL